MLRELKELRLLHLIGTAITDAGMKELRALPNLQYLELAATRVTATHVTDAGIAELKELKSLRTLKLHATAITDAGVAELQRALPNLKVQR